MKYQCLQNTRIRWSSVLFALLLFSIPALAQKQAINPTIEPAIFTANTEITVTYDVTGSTLESLANAWIWVWIPGTNIDAKYNINPASDNTPLSDNARFTKSTENSQTFFNITFTPQDFFDGDISSQQQLGMLLKGNDWSNGQTTDYLANMALEDQFTVLLIKPDLDPIFVNTGEALAIEALASENASYSLSIDNVPVDQQNDVSSYIYSHPVTETEGIIPCELAVTNSTTLEDTTISFNYIIRTATTEQSRPAGIVPGINYDADDDTKATLCLQAPLKSSVYVVGEFNDFTISPDYQMLKDGEHFWLEINGLTPGKEYAFQYLVDEAIYVADPYADKILDPDDQNIPASIYPDLKPFPQEALKYTWYFNRLSIIRTAQAEYVWDHDSYTRPDKENLIIYELLIRDFFGANDRNYSTLIDTIGYFKNLGVNAIELMPVQEFNGNSSWGYNPAFMFAPDKAYGTKDKLKEFIDVAHQHGISVILDVVFNHQDIPNPYVVMYYDESSETPTAGNPWFNVDATHPYSVFFDMNHESDYTKHYMDTTLNYWINEYHVDGFRFDLSKGFTQTVSGTDVSKWGQKDQSRIDIITRMADKVWSYAPDTWLILEHFADNTEEIILADHGLMLWGNMHGPYKETILGYHDSNKSNLEWAYAPERGWQDLNLITYMESHDEERQMYEASLYGNSLNSYDIKEHATGLNRIKAASAFLYFVPGPKMFWQFGELGYDISIEENGRTGEKPILWNYYDDAERKKLHDLIATLINFRTKNPVVSQGEFFWSPEGEVKRLTMGDDNMKMIVIANFGVDSKLVPGNFPAPGVWYDFFTGDSFEIENTGKEMLFEPGEFHIYTSKKVEDIKPGLVPWDANFIITSMDEKLDDRVKLFPNPVNNSLKIQGIPAATYQIIISDANGRLMMNQAVNFSESFETNIGHMPDGMYYLSLTANNHRFTFKFVKN
jgi:glycosidase